MVVNTCELGQRNLCQKTDGQVAAGQADTGHAAPLLVLELDDDVVRARRGDPFGGDGGPADAVFMPHPSKLMDASNDKSEGRIHTCEFFRPRTPCDDVYFHQFEWPLQDCDLLAFPRNVPEIPMPWKKWIQQEALCFQL